MVKLCCESGRKYCETAQSLTGLNLDHPSLWKYVTGKRIQSNTINDIPTANIHNEKSASEVLNGFENTQIFNGVQGNISKHSIAANRVNHFRVFRPNWEASNEIARFDWSSKSNTWRSSIALPAEKCARMLFTLTQASLQLAHTKLVNLNKHTEAMAWPS